MLDWKVALVVAVMIQVFVENPAGTSLKHHYDEKRCVLEGVSTVSRPYPFHYGFILKTAAADGDNVDCFILTDRSCSSGDILECEILGLMEQLEDGVTDHNVIARPLGEEQQLNPTVERVLSEFVSHVFDHKATPAPTRICERRGGDARAGRLGRAPGGGQLMHLDSERGAERKQRQPLVACRAPQTKP